MGIVIDTRNSPDGPDSCEITRAITLVSSHDWHVQPFCQRPDSTPPERRFSGTPGKPWSSSKPVVSPAPKSARDEPFKLTPSGCFLSMWISSGYPGRISFVTSFLTYAESHSIRACEIQRPFTPWTVGALACDRNTRQPCPYAVKHTRKRGPLFN